MTNSNSNLQLTRPLVWLGMETTGTGPTKNRIVKIAILRIEPTGSITNYIRRVDPGPLPRVAALLTRRRGRRNAKMPTFVDIQSRVRELLNGCDLIGHNLKCFAIPFLVAEFARSGSRICFHNCNVVDL